MYFHKPPEVPWKPQDVKKELRRLGINAHAVEGCVTFDITDPGPRFASILKDYSANQPGELIRVVHYAHKFIRNIEFEYDGQAYPRWSREKGRTEVEEMFASVLAKHGYLSLTQELEGSIARRYCLDWDAIATLEAEISVRLERTMELVGLQDFDAAVRERNLKYAAIDRLDAIVKKAAEVNTSRPVD